MEKGNKTDFCKSLDWGPGIQWLDKTGLLKVGGGCLARIELETHGVSGDYPGFLVTIINPSEGVVDKKFFLFNDYLDKTDAGRKDDRVSGKNKWPVGGDEVFYHVVAHCGWNWYIAEPKTTRPFCEAIETYIEFFRR